MINLQKGQTIDLRKNADGGAAYDLSQITIGLGWDVRKQPSGGMLGRLLGTAKEEEYDLDAVAFLLDENGKLINRGNEKLVGSDVVFYNNLRHPSGQIWLTGDNRTGAGDGDDEQIIVRLDTLDAKYARILFVVTIYQGIEKKQHFGMVDNAFIRAVDGRGTEIARYSLSGDASFNTMHSMVFAEAYRRDGSWRFRAIGEPRPTDRFVEILREYL